RVRVADASQNASDVTARLTVGRNPAVHRDRLLAGVVGGEHERQVTVEPVHQTAEVANAALDVLVGVEDVLHPEARGRSGHQLHQAAGATARHRARVELGLGLDDGGHEERRDAVPDGDLPDVRLDLHGGE